MSFGDSFIKITIFLLFSFIVSIHTPFSRFFSSFRSLAVLFLLQPVLILSPFKNTFYLGLLASYLSWKLRLTICHLYTVPVLEDSFLICVIKLYSMRKKWRKRFKEIPRVDDIMSARAAKYSKDKPQNRSEFITSTKPLHNCNVLPHSFMVYEGPNTFSSKKTCSVSGIKVRNSWILELRVHHITFTSLLIKD